ncbi:LolA family protein [Shimia sp.]|uniref:LolA family protein n=1 Tax=Shimia sp. TaxID=1954381 RepID=UPI003BA910D9
MLTYLTIIAPYICRMDMYKKFTALVLAAFWFCHPALAEKASLDVLSGYLNDLKTVEYEFVQQSSDGTVQTGKLFIQRPGKMRFEYAPPQRAVVLASNNAVAIFDGRSNGNPETYPLRRTPLSVLLAKNVNLSSADMVVGHSFDGVHTVVTAQDPKTPESGQIQLKFSDDPVALKEWVIVDEYGTQTTVRLKAVQTGMSFPRSLFDIDSERRRRGQ